jgi:hypothetical protein
MTISPEWAQEFAREWIESWNSHDLDRILSHYTDDFEMRSPLIVERMKDPTACLKGKDQIKSYWQVSLSSTPPLKFETIDVLAGVDSITLYYRSVGRRVVAETLLFDHYGKISRGMAQWSVLGDEHNTAKRA